MSHLFKHVDDLIIRDFIKVPEVGNGKICANCFLVSFFDLEFDCWKVTTLVFLLNTTVEAASDNHSIGIENEADKANDRTELFNV